MTTVVAAGAPVPDARTREPAARRTRLPYAVATAWYAVFIARSSFTVRGRRTFALFDDAMISMTYARNLARGHGLVWYPGAPKVEGITNLGWTLVMALPHLARVPDAWASLTIEVLGALILLACGALAGRLAACMSDRPPVRTIATTFVLFCYPLVFWTLRGMEVGLLTLLLLATALATAQADITNVTRAGAVVAIALLFGVVTRLDFVVFVPVLLTGAVWQHRGRVRRVLVACGAVGALVGVAGQELFRRWYYGEWTPNTYALKLGGTTIGERVTRGGGVVLYLVMTGIGLALIATWWAWQAARGSRDARDGHGARGVIGLSVGLAAAAGVYAVSVGGDAWEWYRYADRYLTPAVVLLLVTAAAGLARGASLDGRSRVRVAVPVVVVAALVGAGVVPQGRTVLGLPATAVVTGLLPAAPLLFAYALLRRGRHGARVTVVLLAFAVAAQVSLPALASWTRFDAAQVDVDATGARLGLTLRAFTRPDASIAISSAGAIAYFARRPAFDILGKMDPVVAREPIHPGWYFFPGHMKWDYSVTLARRPDVFGQLWLATTRAELDAIRAAGYRPWRLRHEVVARLGLDPERDPITFYVRDGSPRVDFAQLVPADAVR